ncbi:uncharacterized protein LACBIDRAFT_314134 [Laccaria bicolor S238N-H82]|uniref:Predicted protein n=1 Tax=Laccaria bicolor (strain S238N-H82 / ATCC MYA-4686) TaxID=486041 RepID=B0D1N9_LACBS|nr:uncharacterized protein LACBIDRAFT_314134 [Laccaria bicolor S238N-H82]EDR12024.1 predicted protein [Laccaria bicolor S238N-H82]|eukprot:XP_001877921.1 predicted protein [Laccaria bicolor S238N-H82]
MGMELTDLLQISTYPVPTASANSDLGSLQEGLRNTSKRKLVRECDCGESIDKVEADDESRIIICRRKGCETLWYHLPCIGLDRGINDWVCDPCKSVEKSRGRGGKQRRTV